MAYFRIDYNSNALRRQASFEMLIPNDPNAGAPAAEWEKPLYTLDYAGRCDRIGIIDGKTAIVDIKTTGTMDRLSRLALLFQLFFYREAYLFSLYDPEKMRRPKALLGIQLKKDGTYTVHEAQKIMDKDMPRWDLYRVMDHLLELTQLIGGYKDHE